MISFLKTGHYLKGVQMGWTTKQVVELIGEPNETVGDELNGFLYYNEYRFGYNSEKIICEMSIEFSRLKNKFVFENLEYKKFDISLYETFSWGENFVMVFQILKLGVVELKVESLPFGLDWLLWISLQLLLSALLLLFQFVPVVEVLLLDLLLPIVVR